MKPKLKLPGNKRLKLRYDEPLSNVAFKINLRRYTSEQLKVKVRPGHVVGRLGGGEMGRAFRLAAPRWTPPCLQA